MKTYYVWKKVNGKKVDVFKLRTESSKDEVKAKLDNQHFDYDGIDVVRGYF